jgi:hypothetical protein
MRFMIIIFMLFSGLMLASRPYYFGGGGGAGSIIYLQSDKEEETEVWYVVGPGLHSLPNTWRYDTKGGFITSEPGFFLTTDGDGNVLLRKKKTEYSQWRFEYKGSIGDSDTRRYVISSDKSPKELKYLAVDRTKVVKKIKGKANGKEVECDAYRLILTAENPAIWEFSSDD